MDSQLSPGLGRIIDQNLLLCPHCQKTLHSSLPTANSNCCSLRCDNNHSFDVARQGYVNLCIGQRGSEAKKKDRAKEFGASLDGNNEFPHEAVLARGAAYDTVFLQGRREAVARGFFNYLSRAVADIVGRYHSRSSLAIFDAGAGEGSFLAELLGHVCGMSLSSSQTLTTMGIDLSVPSIRQASACFPNSGWCVADLSRIPSSSRSWDVVLNVLSPANYQEFLRLKTDQGIIIKVVPTERHLTEIRRHVRNNAPFSNVRVVEHFANSLKIIEQQTIESTIKCGQAGANKLFSMTPLSWHATSAEHEIFITNPPDELTISFELMVGRVR